MGPEYVDVDLDSGWVFPRMVAKLPPPDTALSNGQNGVWFVDNLCVGDNCHLTALIAQEYRRICADGSPDPGDQSCPKVRPFLEVYDDCGVGTQSGNNIVWQATVDGEPQTGTLHEALCYQPTRFVSPITGTDITGKVPGTYWIVAAHRQVIGWKLNPPYGPVPQMALRYERPHTTVNETDHWDDQCAGLAAGGRCTIAAAAHCVDGPATKDIDGDAVWRNCWRYETALSCASTAASNECTGLVAAGCTPVGTVCRQTDAATGTCQLAENTYSCPVAPGTGVSVSNCPANVFCLQGSCFNISAPADADFAQSMSFMEAAREAGVYLDTDTMQVFKGEANACRDRLLKNCCYADDAGAGMSNQSLFGVGSRLVFDVLMNADNRQFVIQGLQALLMGTGFSGSFTTYGVTVAVNGTAVPAGSAVLYSGDSMVIAFDPWSLVIAIVIYVVMSMMSCSADEGKLAMKEGARLCHTVGTYCSSCLRLLGRCVSCLETSTGKCCFNSLLARLINEQGRQQIAKGWGAADTPDCSGFTVAQLQSLNFAAMDLREFYASLVPTLPDVGALQGRNATLAADCYYGQGKCP